MLISVTVNIDRHNPHSQSSQRSSTIFRSIEEFWGPNTWELLLCVRTEATLFLDVRDSPASEAARISSSCSNLMEIIFLSVEYKIRHVVLSLSMWVGWGFSFSSTQHFFYFLTGTFCLFTTECEAGAALSYFSLEFFFWQIDGCTCT